VSAREEILGRIRANLAQVDSLELPEEGAAGQGEPVGSDDLVARFREVLERVDGRVHRVRDEAEARAVLLRLAEERGARRVLVSDADVVARLVEGTQLSVVESRASREEQLEAQLGLTTAQWAIAETGTLVLVSDRERHRLASLLPETHVAVLEASAILPSLGAALAAVSQDELAGRTVTFVTGPSRTADIELTLVVGVHGPRELHVLLIDP